MKLNIINNIPIFRFLLYNATMDETRQARRQPITVKRDCAMGVITFERLDWTDYHASIVDISKNGVGIESKSPLEPGLVWFRDRIWGQHSGVLLWSKQMGAHYRSGIRFAPLPRDAEQFVNNQIAKSSPLEPLRDLDKIVATLFESIKHSPSQ